jgi:hypothetical protein
MAGPAVLIAHQEYRDMSPCIKIINIIGLYLHICNIFKLAMKEFMVLSDNFVGTYEITELVGEIPYVILMYDPFPLPSHYIIALQWAPTIYSVKMNHSEISTLSFF